MPFGVDSSLGPLSSSVLVLPKELILSGIEGPDDAYHVEDYQKYDRRYDDPVIPLPAYSIDAEYLDGIYHKQQHQEARINQYFLHHPLHFLVGCR